LTTRLESEKLREQIYTLYLRGASRNEIAETLGIARSVAHYHISQMRLKNEQWFREHSDMEKFLRGWVKELWDRHLQAYREIWRLYEAVEVTEEKDIRLKSVLLGEAQECLDKLRLLYTSITKSIRGYDFYPEEDEKGPTGSSASQFSQIFSSLNSPSTVPDLAMSGKLAGQESKSPDPEPDHANTVSK
jgi:hypothetical protein